MSHRFPLTGTDLVRVEFGSTWHDSTKPDDMSTLLRRCRSMPIGIIWTHLYSPVIRRYRQKVWIKSAAPVVPSFSLQWKSVESIKYYLTQLQLPINWRYWHAGKIHACVWRFKMASWKRALLKSTGFSQTKVEYFSNRVVCCLISDVREILSRVWGWCPTSHCENLIYQIDNDWEVIMLSISTAFGQMIIRSAVGWYILFHKALTNPMDFWTRRFNASFTRALQ
jgi:hypothetical protein